MKQPLPVTFNEALTAQRLTVVAEALLDVRFITLQTMSTEDDDAYTQETAVFGRSRNVLIKLATSGVHDWLELANPGMDVTIKIGGVPCRFFRDDPDNPEKSGFFRRNAVDDLFAPDEREPVMWRFVIEKTLTEDGEDRLVFAGYNAFQELVSEWIYDTTRSGLHSVGSDVPAAAEIPPVDVDVVDDQALVERKRSGDADYGN